MITANPKIAKKLFPNICW